MLSFEFDSILFLNLFYDKILKSWSIVFQILTALQQKPLLTSHGLNLYGVERIITLGIQIVNVTSC